MMPGLYPLVPLYRGDSAQWQVVIWLDLARSVPYNLTGVSPKAEIRDMPGGSLIIPLGSVVTLPNIIDVDLGAGWSEQLPQTGVWDLQLTYASGQVFTILAGDVKVVADVTNSDRTTWAADRPVRTQTNSVPRLVPVPRRGAA